MSERRKAMEKKINYKSLCDVVDLYSDVMVMLYSKPKVSQYLKRPRSSQIAMR